jgi:hypothetical protein
MRSVCGRAAWLAVVVAALMFMTGCGGPVRFTRTVSSDGENYVRLEARYGHGQGYGYDGAAMPFTHPVVLSETEWERILKRIRVQPRKRLLSIGAGHPDPRAAFDERERQYLARHLAQAFSMARSDEWVVFCLRRQREEGEDLRGGPAIADMTSGGFFVEGEQLRLALANYRYAVSMPIVQEQIRDYPLRPAGDALYEFVPSRHQKARQVPTINTSWDLAQPLRAHLSELVVEYQALLSLPDETMLEPDLRPPLEERLRTLKRLHEQGLITDEDYRVKRQKLLDEL